MYTIFVIGKPGSGKSNLIWYLSSLLDEDGVSPKYISDRLGLEEATLKEVRYAKPDKDGIKVGTHSKLIADGPPGHRKVHVLDGYLLNNFHIETIKRLSTHSHSTKITLIEYAIGPNIDFGNGKEPLLQDAKHLVTWIKKYHILKTSIVIDVDAPFSVRERREARRPDAMAAETFRAYFPDGGEITKTDAKKLGRHYYRFKNYEEDYDGYFNEARYIYESRIRPKIVGSKKI